MRLPSTAVDTESLRLSTMRSKRIYFSFLSLIILVLWNSMAGLISVSWSRSQHIYDDRPPIADLILPNNTVKGVKSLLDFVIAGHPKTATTSMMIWLAKHPEIRMHTRELHSMHQGNPAGLVRELYELPPGKRGYKSPNEIRMKGSLYTLNKLFGDYKIIVGVRHPVKWFQSWYNFKLRQAEKKPIKMLPAETLVGDKQRRQIMYHNNLALLNKTPMGPDEQALLQPFERPPSTAELRMQKQLFEMYNIPDNLKMKNKVFLYEYEQFGDKDETRHAIFRHDLQTFLDLSIPLSAENGEMQNIGTNLTQIDICHFKYRQLRNELVELGTAASTWIRKYFMYHPDVVVSSPAYFESLLESWSKDPCREPYSIAG